MGRGARRPRRVARETALITAVATQLDTAGFAVFRGVVGREALARLRATYERAVANGAPPDLSVKNDLRLHGLVNADAEFDALYVCGAFLDACRRVIRAPFKLGCLLARTVPPGAAAQQLHADIAADARGWPMVGFIVMLDDFRADNGATRFVPGSHRRAPPLDDGAAHVLACAPAGSAILYNGCVWHGYTANRSGGPRRSVQGSYVRHDVASWLTPARVAAATVARASPLARQLLGLS